MTNTIYKVSPFPYATTFSSARSGWYAVVKRSVELVLSVALLILAAPVIVVFMALVRITSRGPALYRQSRVGLNGRTFVIYKIRTMVQNAEVSTGPRWTARNDPRITLLGSFLRRSHLDELPQLWNILRGDMSLVGPRPERPEFVLILERAIPRYCERLTVRPGLTGLAQVQLPPDTDFEGVRRKLTFDLYYIQHVDLWLDLKLLACTAMFLVGIPFVLSCRCLRVPTLETAEEARRSSDMEFEPLGVQAEPA
jgi:lipopolysaccharide/colanic/teichoic acid biosynthesis glycosyltransferase